MHADVHKAITLTVTHILGIEDFRSRRIAEAATTPDLTPDYFAGRRATHHGTPSSLLKEIAIEARHSWLEGKWDKADYMVGRLLHYLQDGPIPSPNVNRSLHDNLERKCSKLDPTLFINKVEKVTPVGKMETLNVLSNRKVASTPEEAMEEALKNSFSIVSSIFSPIFAPPKFSSLGNEAYSFFKSRSKEMFLYSLLWISLLIPLTIGMTKYADIIFLLGFLTAFLVWAIIYNGICMFTIALSSNMNEVLYKARWIHDHISLNSILLVLTILYHVMIPIIALTIILLVYSRFLKFPAWKAIKEEIDWYIWK
jgi:hypothetical protein